ncbi:hypothetical protein [Pantoea phage Nufs112]|nr:hypothetical protein [Pantoea phage Nufs112]
MTLTAVIEEFNPELSCQQPASINSCYTHTVVVWCDKKSIFADLVDIVDFRNEFAARTFEEAINMGLVV